MPRLSERMLAFLSDVDGERHIAVAARVRGRCVGIARAVVSRDRASVADVAVAVADDHQRQGLGRRLIHALAADARAVGIREFEGSIHPGNDAARGLARSMAATASYDEGMLRAQLSLGAAQVLHVDFETISAARFGGGVPAQVEGAGVVAQPGPVVVEHRADEAAQHLGRFATGGGLPLEQVAQPALAELDALRIAGLDDAVGVEQQRVTRLEAGLDDVEVLGRPRPSR